MGVTYVVTGESSRTPGSPGDVRFDASSQDLEGSMDYTRIFVFGYFFLYFSFKDSFSLLFCIYSFHSSNSLIVFL